MVHLLRFPSSSGPLWWSWGSPGTAVSLPGSSGSSGALPGEFSCSPCSDRSPMCSDVVRSFLGLSIVSSALFDTLDASASWLVRVSSKLGHGFFFPLSSTLGGSFCGFVGSSGGGGSGDPQVRRRHLVRCADRVHQLTASIAPTRSRFFSPPQTMVLDMSLTSPSRPSRLVPCLRPPCWSVRLHARVQHILAFATRSVHHLG